MVLGVQTSLEQGPELHAHQRATKPAEVLAEEEEQEEQVLQDLDDVYIWQPEDCCGVL